MRPEDAPDRLLPLWFGILGPPVFWAMRISASYVMVPFVCEYGGVLVLHGVTVAALAGATAAGLVAWGTWRGSRSATPRPARGERARFMGLIGVLSAGFFFAVIVAESLANFIVDPCLTAGAPL